ncbi:RNA polymerase sigma factor [Singulisphaera sp. PoT]|uniref:RNA polymerase sigma factor n=1 Tax=Singulisphaera sp. PoT TaxID=3411797 RepID=UPI003BF4E169
MLDTTEHSPWPESSHWSVIAAAGRPDTEAGRLALAAFCDTFRGPVYSYLRRDGCNQDEAQDLTQEFFLYLVGDSRPLAEYDKTRGRFRPYFLAALRHFRANRRRYDSAARRGGGRHLLSIDHPSHDAGQVADPGPLPEVAFTRAWAEALLDRVVSRIREESARSARMIPLESLLGRLIDGRSGSYRDLADELGLTPGSLRVAAHRLRERFETLLREEIARTVSTSEEVDEEINAMFEAFSLTSRR